MTREEQLSLAVLRTLARLALDLADICGLGPERRVERLTILFAAWSGHLRLAETLQTALRKHRSASPAERRAAGERAGEAGHLAGRETRSTGWCSTTARCTRTRRCSGGSRPSTTSRTRAVPARRGPAPLSTSPRGRRRCW